MLLGRAVQELKGLGQELCFDPFFRERYCFYEALLAIQSLVLVDCLSRHRLTDLSAFATLAKAADASASSSCIGAFLISTLNWLFEESLTLSNDQHPGKAFPINTHNSASWSA